MNHSQSNETWYTQVLEDWDAVRSAYSAAEEICPFGSNPETPEGVAAWEHYWEMIRSYEASCGAFENYMMESVFDKLTEVLGNVPF